MSPSPTPSPSALGDGSAGTTSGAGGGRLLAASVLGAVAVWFVLGLQRALINKDGVLYVEAARAVGRGDLGQAFDIFPWPFMAIPMAGIAAVLGVSHETAGHLLNLAAWVVAVVTLLRILARLGGSSMVLAYGAVLLLLHPQSLDTLSGILRGPGYAAFALLGILLFMRFRDSGRWWEAAGALACLVAATLFRVEGVVLIASLPLVLALDRWLPLRQRLGRAGLLVALPAAVLLAAGAVSLLGPGEGAGEVTSRAVERFEREIRGVQAWAEELPAKADGLADAVLDHYSRHHAVGATLAALSYVLAWETIRGVNLLYLVLAVWPLPDRRRPPRPEHRWMIGALAGVQVLMLAAFVLKEGYLSPRYTIGLALLVMMRAAFVLAAEHEAWRAAKAEGRPRWQFPAVLVLLAVIGFDGLISTGVPDHQERDAGAWVQAELPEESVFFQSVRTRYYAGRPWERSAAWSNAQVLAMIRDGRMNAHAYAVIDVRPGDDAWRARLDEQPTLELVEAFTNRKGGAALIFRVVDPEAEADAAAGQPSPGA